MSETNTGFLSSKKGLQAGYEALTTTWSISAAMHLISFSLLAQATLAARSAFALSYSHYLLVILVLKHLHDAVSRNLLGTDNNKSLNLAFAISVAFVASMTASPAVGSGLLRMAAPFTALIAGVIGVVVPLRAWSLNRTAGKNAMWEVMSGFGSTVSSFFQPKNVAGAVYRLLALVLLGQSALTILFPAEILMWAGTPILALEGGELALVQWGSALIFESAAAFALARGADSAELSKTQYKDLNVGFVLTLLLQALLVCQTLFHASKIMEFPMGALPFMLSKQFFLIYGGVSAAFAAFCALAHLKPSIAAAAQAAGAAGAAGAGTKEKPTGDDRVAIKKLLEEKKLKKEAEEKMEKLMRKAQELEKKMQATKTSELKAQEELKELEKKKEEKKKEEEKTTLRKKEEEKKKAQEKEEEKKKKKQNIALVEEKMAKLLQTAKDLEEKMAQQKSRELAAKLELERVAAIQAGKSEAEAAAQARAAIAQEEAEMKRQEEEMKRQEEETKRQEEETKRQEEETKRQEDKEGAERAKAETLVLQAKQAREKAIADKEKRLAELDAKKTALEQQKAALEKSLNEATTSTSKTIQVPASPSTWTASSSKTTVLAKESAATIKAKKTGGVASKSEEGGLPVFNIIVAGAVLLAWLQLSGGG